MSITVDLLNSYARRLVTPFHLAADRCNSPVPHSFVVRSDSVTYGLGYSSQVLERDGRADLARRALMDAAEETELQIAQHRWLFTAEEVKALRVVSRETRNLVGEEATSAIRKGVATPA